MPGKIIAFLLLASIPFLSGCVGLLAVGGATAIVAANDRRTAGALLDDQNIELKIGSAIRDEPALKDVHVNATSINGVVLLTGETPTAEQRDQVLGAIRQVRGIRRTVNEVRIAPPSAMSERTHDSWITSKVKAKLLRTEKLDSSQVKVVTENASVYLMGLLTKAEAEIATNSAAEVDGVERLVKLFEYLD